MNRLFLWIAAASALVLQSCEKADGIRDEIGKLSDRVAALETRVGEVNTSIEALHRLMDESTVIVGVTPDEKGYVLELSDGSKYLIIEGEKLDALVPLLNIDAEGYWIVSLDGGATFTRLLVGGSEVPAWPVADGEHVENASGITPRLRVAADGTWEVSLDGGATYEPLLQNGQPVNAVGGNVVIGYSSVFKEVEYDEEGGLLSIELLSGGKLTLPVCDDFGLEIVAGESEKFYLGETRSFEVVQSNVAEAVIQAPAGWRAELTETELIVTAPAVARQAEEPVTLSVVVTSPKGYLKIVPLEVVLLNEQLDANACAAWRNFKAGTADNVLLDYSYAGYGHGEVAPPDVWGLGYKVYNVLDYGLDPTGQTSSREAFCALLRELKLYRAPGDTHANANARAIIYFPEGDYVLHDETDDARRDTPIVNEGQTIEYSSSDIILLGGNFVIKGAGRDKTRLIMKTKNYPATSDLWSSPVMLNIKHNSTRIGNSYSALTSVTEDAAKGAFSVKVASTAGISAGDWVMLYLQNNDPELVAKELAPKTVDKPAMTDIQTVCVYDYHQVKSVGSGTVTFHEPIMHEVEARYNWEIREFPHYENVGVEDLTFVGDAKENFGHHVSWEDDGAFKPLNMMRLTNSWVRRVDFEDVSEALTFSSAANCSAYDITITGNRGHSAVRAQGSSRVFIGKVVDRTSGYECTTSSGLPGGTFLDNAGQYHASGVSNQSIGTVLWNNTWGDDALFESHSKQPRATLVDRCTGGFVQWRFGGDVSNVPNHLRDLTLWNLNATRAKHDFGGGVFKWWLPNNDWWKIMPPIIVGFHGAAVNFGVYSEAAGGWAETESSDELQTLYLESNGTPVEPQSLYEAQLRERLGYVPGWLNSLK